MPEPVVRPSPLRREFRAKMFLRGVVVILLVVIAAGAAVKAWPQLAGLTHSDAHPKAPFGKTITVGTTDYHPKLALSMTVPHRLGSAAGVAKYVVDFSVSNEGSTAWLLPPRSAFVAVDSLGESHALSAISGTGSSTWSGRLLPNQHWSGLLSFEIRSSRTPLRLRFVLGGSGSESATWVAQ
ncbi:MAG: hypothetical protein NVSMB48_18690 [Marmoricola sp.]